MNKNLQVSKEYFTVKKSDYTINIDNNKNIKLYTMLHLMKHLKCAASEIKC